MQNLPGGWVLVAADRCDHRILSPENLASLSAGCEAVACAIEEHVNFASSEFWIDGRRLWRVAHADDEGPENVSTEGSPPESFQQLIATAEPWDSENMEGHFHFDIPLILAKDLAGYRHDEVDEVLGVSHFLRLRDTKPRAAWWKLWR
jgi:hypothetical protein